MEQPQEEPQELPAIEVLPPIKTKFYETQGGEITVYRLRLMTEDEIDRHGLSKYAIRDSAENLNE